ncbi:MAG: CAP domain-containing protein [Actinomycetota bacterium]|nr:CAP domain-containing protein [Actinomycetota bacterium]
MRSLLPARHRGTCRAEPRIGRGFLVLLVIGLLSAWTSAGAQAADRAGNLDAAEQQVMLGINQIRAQYGLGALRPSRALTVAANVHSQDMAARRYYGHNTLGGAAWNSRIKRFVRARVVGETLDLLYGPPGGPHDDPGVVVSDWLHSAPHRAVLLTASLRRIGVAHATLRNGRPAFFTADFAS